MSFTRVKPGGFSIGDKLTSSQMNQLDSDHANSLDKTVAGDQIAGIVSLNSGASLRTSLGTIRSDTAGGIFSAIAGGIQSGAVGGFQLTGGSTDWPTFSATRSRVINQTLDDGLAVGTNVVAQGTVPAFFTTTGTNMPELFGCSGGMMPAVVNTATNNVWAYHIPLNARCHNGATLGFVTVWLAAASAHTNLPVVMPAFGVFRSLVSTPGTADQPLNSAGYVIDPSATLAAYKTAHSWTLATNQFNVIDTTQYNYALCIWDEGGGNAVAFNIYGGCQLSFTGIPNMQFP